MCLAGKTRPMHWVNNIICVQVICSRDRVANKIMCSMVLQHIMVYSASLQGYFCHLLYTGTIPITWYTCLIRLCIDYL